MLFRSSANAGFAVSGAKVLDVAASGLSITGGLTVSGTLSFPAGGIPTAAYADDSITYAKIQNVSATSRVLGRKTSGAGDAEECTLSEVLDFIGSAAQGDILYRDGSAWARLGAGTSGQVLKTQGAASNPTWAAAGMVLIQTQTASASATLDFTTGLNDTYDDYLVIVSNLAPATDDVQFQMQVGTGGGPTWQTTLYQTSYTLHVNGSASNLGSSSLANMHMAASTATDGVGNASGEHWSGQIWFDNPDAAKFQQFRFQGSYVRAASNHICSVAGAGGWFSAAAITGLRFKFSSGNIASGRISLYGISKV